MRKETGKEFRY